MRGALSITGIPKYIFKNSWFVYSLGLGGSIKDMPPESATFLQQRMIYDTIDKDIGHTPMYDNKPSNYILYYTDAYGFIFKANDQYKIFARTDTDCDQIISTWKTALKVIRYSNEYEDNPQLLVPQNADNSEKCIYDRAVEKVIGSAFVYKNVLYKITNKIGVCVGITYNDRDRTRYYVFTYNETERSTQLYTFVATDRTAGRTNLRQFVTDWDSKGNYCEDSATVILFNLDHGAFVCDFLALLLDPAKSKVSEYLYTRAHARLETKLEFSMNCWQVVLLYLHKCHGLTLDDIRALYARL